MSSPLRPHECQCHPEPETPGQEEFVYSLSLSLKRKRIELLESHFLMLTMKKVFPLFECLDDSFSVEFTIKFYI